MFVTILAIMFIPICLFAFTVWKMREIEKLTRKIILKKRKLLKIG
jgi:hypothetical protein